MPVQLSDGVSVRSPRLGATKIYEVMKHQIADGVYGASGILPSSRALAAELGVSRATVTIAYEQLHAEGFIEMRQGALPRVARPATGIAKAIGDAQCLGDIRLSKVGTRILDFGDRRSVQTEKTIVDFRHGDLAGSDFPMAAWRRAIHNEIKKVPHRLTYLEPRGSIRLRIALQGYLWRARTIRCEPDQIIVVNGTQQGLDLCARLLLDPQDRFVIEDPGYNMARQILAAGGAKAIGVPVDDGGLNTSLLANIDANLAYVTPSHQFPLGGVMPITRRHQLLSWSRKRLAFIFEDDYDSEFRFDLNPIPPLYGLEESERVIYSGTISKTIAPSLRIGYLVVPRALSKVFATAKLLTDRQSPILQQEAVATLIENGSYERHVRRIRRLHHERRATLLNALRHKFADRIVVEGADAGLHVVVWLKDVAREHEHALLAEAEQIGLGIHPISQLYHRSDDAPFDRVGLVMGYSSLDVRQIERGVHLLAQLLGKR